MSDYSADLLGEGYEQQILNFPDDYEGRVIATLVRKKPIILLIKLCYIFMAILTIFFKRNGRAI